MNYQKWTNCSCMSLHRSLCISWKHGLHVERETRKARKIESNWNLSCLSNLNLGLLLKLSAYPKESKIYGVTLKSNHWLVPSSWQQRTLNHTLDLVFKFELNSYIIIAILYWGTFTTFLVITVLVSPCSNQFWAVEKAQSKSTRHNQRHTLWCFSHIFAVGYDQLGYFRI